MFVLQDFLYFSSLLLVVIEIIVVVNLFSDCKLLMMCVYTRNIFKVVGSFLSSISTHIHVIKCMFFIAQSFF